MKMVLIMSFTVAERYMGPGPKCATHAIPEVLDTKPNNQCIQENFHIPFNLLALLSFRWHFLAFFGLQYVSLQKLRKPGCHEGMCIKAAGHELV